MFSKYRKYLLLISVVIVLTVRTTCPNKNQKFPTSPLGSILWSASWSHDDHYIAVGGEDGRLVIYETENYQPFKTYTWDSATITNVQWHPDRYLLAMTGYSYKSILEDSIDRIINIENGNITKLDHYGSRGLDWNSNGTALALADLEGDVHIYSNESIHIRSFPSGNPRSLTGISWHLSDTILAIIGDDIRLMNINGQLIKQIQHSSISKLLLSVDWHPSGRYFATAGYGHEGEPTFVKFWTVDGKLLKTIPGSAKEIRNIQWNQAGEYLATASEALRLVDTAGVIKHTYPYGENLLWGLDWNRDQTKLLISGFNNLIEVVDKEGKRIQTISR
ncbi:MAG: hypothetical protein SH818_16785 [Saprospiraceae bacterium]|nr:hypothetical protein [Saprospiraceae bacterium]